MSSTKTFNFAANKNRIITLAILVILFSAIIFTLMNHAARLDTDKRIKLKLDNAMEQMTDEINLEYEKNIINLKHASSDNSLREALLFKLDYQPEYTRNCDLECDNIFNLVVADTTGKIIFSNFNLLKKNQVCTVEIEGGQASGQYNSNGYTYFSYPVYVNDKIAGKVISFFSLMNFTDIIDRYLKDRELNVNYELWEYKPLESFCLYGNHVMRPVNKILPDIKRSKLMSAVSLINDGTKFLNREAVIWPQINGSFSFITISAGDYVRLSTIAFVKSIMYSVCLIIAIMFALIALDRVSRVSMYRKVKAKVILENLRMQKHEFLRHINIVNGLIQHNEFDKLKNYIESITTNISYLYEIDRLINPAVAILLKEKEEECAKNEIFFSFKTNTRLDNIRFEEYDICTILGNLIDNAVDAVLKSDSNRRIEVEINYQSGFYIFIITNSGPAITRKEINKIFKWGYSTKKSRKGHGIGLYIVKRELLKCKGNMEVESLNGRTVFTVCLPE